MKANIIKYISPSLLFSFIVWLIFQADMDKDNLFMTIAHEIPYGDKIGHFLLFGILALLINKALNYRMIRRYNIRLYLGSVIVFVFAFCEECSQLAFETRKFDVVDMLFDLFGIGLLSSISCRRFVVKKLQSMTSHLSKRLRAG